MKNKFHEPTGRKKKEEKRNTSFHMKRTLDFVSFTQPGNYTWPVPPDVFGGVVATVIGAGGGATATGFVDDVAGRLQVHFAKHR